MTAVAATDPAPVTTATVLRRAAAAEWTRLVTVRSTWWSLLAAAAMMLFIGTVAAAEHDGVEAAPIWVPAQLAIVPAQFAFALVVLLAVAGEYGTGAIRSSVQWVPRRGVLLAARTLVPVVFTTACAVGAAGVTNLVTWALVGESAEVVPADIAASIARIALVVAFVSTLTAGISLLLRSTAGTLAAIFLLVMVLPIALGNSGVPALVTISDTLPGRAIVSVIVIDGVELTGRAIATVMGLWTAGTMLAGGWSLLRRDTT